MPVQQRKMHSYEAPIETRNYLELMTDQELPLLICPINSAKMQYITVQIKLKYIPFPSIKSSCPWEPTNVLDKKGAKSTIISLKRGHTEPRAVSSF